MGKNASNYISHTPDKNGFVNYTPENHRVWSELFERQGLIIKDRATREFSNGLHHLGITSKNIPQAKEVNQALKSHTGWGVEMVPAVIPALDFFALLANKKFPMATFIRSAEEIDYLKEPDIFHEVYGHCPLLTNQAYADFVQWYGETSLKATKLQRKYLFRVFWFTIEFGLINTADGKRIYGGGILSSKKETLSCLEKGPDHYINFDILTAMRTPFRIDIVQPFYFVINSFDDLYAVMKSDLMSYIDQAIELGDLTPKQTPYDKDGNVLPYTN